VQRPTRIAEVMPDYPSIIGSVDLAKAGMGGIVFAPGQPPTLWQAAFPTDVQACIISTMNHAGDITNRDLRLECWARLMLWLPSLTFGS
jgi:hypothetical protein